MLDPRLGKSGEILPTACIVSGQPVRGMSAIEINLRDGYYCNVLSKHHSKVTDALLDEITALIPPPDTPEIPDETDTTRKPKRN